MSLTDRDAEVARYVLAIQRAESDGRWVPTPPAGLLSADECRELRIIVRRSNARADRLGR